MKEYDILGGQNILWPLPYIFRGQDPRNPQVLRPPQLYNPRPWNGVKSEQQIQ